MTNTQTPSEQLHWYASDKPMYSQTEVLRTILATAIVTLVIGLGVGLLLSSGLLQSAGALLPCPTEDSTNCYWDADTMGNGQGNDFVSVGDAE